MMFISLIKYEYKWSTLDKNLLKHQMTNKMKCSYPSSLASWHWKFTTYLDAIDMPRGSVFKQNWPSPMALVACLVWKAPLLLWPIQIPDYFSISNSPFIFSGQWKRRAEQLKSLIQVELFHLLSRSCFTISECHLIFTPNISINLTAGMSWLLIAERKTCLKKRHKGGIFSCHPHQWWNSLERVCPGHKDPGEICPCLFTQYGA